MNKILSIYHRRGNPIEPGIVNTMLSVNEVVALDGQDIWIDGNVALANQGFWVTPEEVGNRQPLIDEITDCSIVTDTRLDNRMDLINMLELDSQQTRSATDAYLILEAYKKWESACPKYLRGDFAFIIWDPRSNKLFVATDVLGARNLCYFINSETCVIATDILTIQAHPSSNRELNEGKIAESLANLFNNQNETFFKDIYYLSPGHTLSVSEETVILTRYWDIDTSNRIRYKREEEYSDHYLSILKKTTMARMRTVGPLGISMSGGLDSTSIAAVASEMLPKTGLNQPQLMSFSYAFDELASCDERIYIEAMSNHFSLNTNYVLCDHLWTLKGWPQDWPFDPEYPDSDPFCLLPLAVVEAASQAGCRTLLSGYFGDVLFEGGYFWALDLFLGYHWLQIIKEAAKGRKFVDWRTDFFEHGLRDLIPSSWKHAYRRAYPRSPKTFHPGITTGLIRRTDLAQRVEQGQDNRMLSSPGQWSRYQSLTLNMFPQGAAASRKIYNRRGIELESPYWDRELIEFVMAIPADQLYRPNQDRRLFRRAMGGLLPDTIRLRKDKTSFFPLMEKGLLDKEKDNVKKLMTDPMITQFDFIRQDWIDSVLAKQKFDDQEMGLIWLCLSLEVWLRRLFGSNE